jgi:YidC/Oxa1 family membrane protein insertase
MQQQTPLFSRNVIIAILLSILLVLGWGYLQRMMFPPVPAQESFAIVGGGLTMGIEHPEMVKKPRSRVPEKPPEKKDATSDFDLALQQIASGTARSFDRAELIGMHTQGSSQLRVVLNSRGGSVQQVILPHFEGTNRLGLADTTSDGKPRPLFLIPGVRKPRTLALNRQKEIPPAELLPDGRISPRLQAELDEPCYVMYHYEAENHDRPVDLLGKRVWRVKEKSIGTEFDEQKVVFETDLGDPYYLTIEKVFTLKRDEYHIGLKVNLIPQPLPEGVKSRPPFRYQTTTAHSLPLEGEWYTSTYHVAMTGFVDRSGSGSRAYEDAREIHVTSGGDRVLKTENKSIQWTGAAVQYFASVLAVDDQQSKRNFLEYTRSTPFYPTGFHNKDFPFLDDATTRAITEKLSFLDNQNKVGPVSHSYLLYQGPIKVRLLKSLDPSHVADEALKANYQPVKDELVDRYINKLNLDTLTDAPMPNALGRFANSIYWTDIVIAFTNLIHWLLGVLYSIIPNLGICIVLVTLLVRSMLFPLSRKQAINGQIMSQRMAKVAPELRKIKEKYRSDFMKMREETLKLYREHNINPAAMLGGCFTLILQMPIFMGLYYALQESIFFRLESFLWMPNLSAPDMLLWWGEAIPFFSNPGDMGGFLYLGPYFNILPLIAVALMLYQQKKMMPVSEDPQIQQQQKIMKYMLIFMALFFYKVAAGLCIYFTISTAWGIIERRMTPKIKLDEKTGQPLKNGQPMVKSESTPKNGRIRSWWNNLLEQAQHSREIRREEASGDVAPQPPQRGSQPPRPDKKGKKKKKR